MEKVKHTIKNSEILKNSIVVINDNKGGKNLFKANGNELISIELIDKDLIFDLENIKIIGQVSYGK